ncbi:MAG: outer membrane beta-barrel protein [Ferruginibacter sp.]|nr:outer membrane beta-barrel protein [Ferruginibacter sp.]
MKILFLSAVTLLSCTIAQAQNLHLTLFGGISNYQGDLQSKRFTFEQAKAAFGIGALYEFSDKLYLRANLNFGKVAGDDKISGKYLSRNLSFSSPVTDIHLGLEYDLLNLYERSVTPFVFAGISAFHFNPSAIDSAGRKVFLQGLGTEGQGFYQGRTKYNLTTMALPFGGGLKLALSENIRIRFEIGIRKTFTDYLDDVSTTYADETLLLINNGQRAVDLAFRGDELKATATAYPAAGIKRGNPGSKDWYYFTGVGISFRLAPKYGNGGGSGKTGCPVNIY